MTRVKPDRKPPPIRANPGELSESLRDDVAGPLARRSEMTWQPRIGLILAGFMGLVSLGVAVSLPPDPQGFGTHQQLGFPPCTFIQLFEIPCPSCGMTTSWSHLVRGDLYRAFRANCGGALLGLAAIILSPWFLVSGIIGRWWISPPNMFAGFFILLGITILTILQWLIWVFFFPL